MFHNYQYSIAKENQIKMCDRRDAQGICKIFNIDMEIMKTPSRKNIKKPTQEEKYLCENLIKYNDCPL